MLKVKLSGWITFTDHYTVNFIKTHGNLIMAVISLFLFLWGVAFHSPLFLLGMVILGAVSFYFGISLALLGGVGFTIIDIIRSLGHGGMVTSLVVDVVGYICITWLGYHHRGQLRLQKAQDIPQLHSDQIVPWVVLNEVRTSLAAVRYLLFPLDAQHANDLEKITAELSRLEHLFAEIEREKMSS
jgi:hypothetical protein